MTKDVSIPDALDILDGNSIRQKVVRLYRKGETIYSLKKMFDMSPATVHKILEIEGVKGQGRRKNEMDEQMLDKVEKLYDKGFSVFDIGVELGMPINEIEEAIKQIEKDEGERE